MIHHREERKNYPDLSNAILFEMFTQDVGIRYFVVDVVLIGRTVSCVNL